MCQTKAQHDTSDANVGSSSESRRVQCAKRANFAERCAENRLGAAESHANLGAGMSNLPPIGTLVADKYRIEAMLGEGGMGAVFRARHEVMDKLVALKWLQPNRAEDPAFRDRFIREARVAARIRHTNVVDVYDVGVHHGALFMVMELLHGEGFDRILERGCLPIPAALRLLVGSMKGVAAAHECQIIHRDIKPENIFVVYDAEHPDGLAKVLDFGISKLTDESRALPRVTNTGATLGTPLYMSFEQMNGWPNIDQRTDVYSFGVLLYRALTGAHPFDGENYAALAIAVATHQPRTPKQRRPELPGAIDSIVMKAMARDRNDRHATLHELIDALTLLASTEGFLGQMTQPSASPPLLTPKTPAPNAAVHTGNVGPQDSEQSPPRKDERTSRSKLRVSAAYLALASALLVLAILTWIHVTQPERRAKLMAAHPKAPGAQETTVYSASDPAMPVAAPIASPPAADAQVIAETPAVAPAAATKPSALRPRKVRKQAAVTGSGADVNSEKSKRPPSAPEVSAIPVVEVPPASRSAAGKRSGILRRDEL